MVVEILWTKMYLQLRCAQSNASLGNLDQQETAKQNSTRYHTCISEAQVSYTA